MATNTNSNVTRKSALEAAIALFAEDAPEREVLAKMLTSISKTRPTDSSKRELNSRLARQVADLFRDKGAFTNADVRSAVNGPDWVGSNGTVSPQKVTAVLRQGVSDNILVSEVIGSGRTHITQFVVK